MTRIEMLNTKKVHEITSHEPGVVAAVAEKALEAASIAEGKLALHKKKGLMRIDVEQGVTDSSVVLSGKGAVSFEFGHINSGLFEHLAPKPVPPQRVLTKTRMEMKK